MQKTYFFKKRFFIFVLTFLIPFLSFAQTAIDTSIRRQSMVFDQFIDGKVLLKSGALSEAPLNYLSTDQSILFKKEDVMYTLTDLNSIDTIYISGRKFVPFNNIVYEVVSNIGKVALLVSYKSRLKPLIATVDHTGSSKQSINVVSNTVSDVYLTRMYKGNYAVEIVKHYWLKNYTKVNKAYRLKDFLNTFKESSHQAISNFEKANHINYSVESDMIKLLNFCNSN
jgi:hypothetical protein